MSDITLQLSPSATMHGLQWAQPPSAQAWLALYGVHGADRHLQNAAHWNMHGQAISSMSPVAHFVGVDLPGHGQSVPGESSPASDVPGIEARSSLLAEFILRHLPAASQAVLVGRSLGGQTVLRALAQSPALCARTAALVLIAPAVQPEFVAALPPEIKAKPALLCWAEDDPFVPFALTKVFQHEFRSVDLCNFGPIAPPPQQAWRAHLPENEQPSVFHAHLASFLSALNSH